jgi:sulfofructose kinase
LRAAFAGYLSGDVFGTLHRAELENEGVDLAFTSSGNAPMRVSTIVVKPGGARSIVHHAVDPNQADPAAVEPGWRARVVLFDGYEARLARAVLESRPADALTVLDAGSVREGTLLLAGRVDHLVASRVFATSFTGCDDPMDACRALLESAPTAVVTLGADGAVWARRGGEAGRVAAVPVAAVDTTGAGDAFHAGYAAGLARRLPFDAVLRLASLCGAAACRMVGARPGMPRSEELEGLGGV